MLLPGVTLSVWISNDASVQTCTRPNTRSGLDPTHRALGNPCPLGQLGLCEARASASLLDDVRDRHGHKVANWLPIRPL